MEALLLILILSGGDPASLAAAQAVAAALHEQDAKAQIVLPPESAKILAERGLRDADLVERSEKPLLATAADLRLVLVRVERREVGSDQVIDVELWSGGRSDRMSAVAGKAGDPLSSAAEGSRRLLREASHDPAVAADRSDTTLVAGFVERGAWQELVAAVEARADARPRLRHAAILARLRLGDHAGAVAALAALSKDFPGHALTKAATVAVDEDAGGAETLRDAAPADDGGNTLR